VAGGAAVQQLSFVGGPRVLHFGHVVIYSCQLAFVYSSSSSFCFFFLRQDLTV
jgi:hypothetical protein